MKTEFLAELSKGEMLIHAAMAGMFCIYSVQDIRKRSINLLILLFIVPLIVTGICFQGGNNLDSALAGGVFGGIMYLFSIYSKGGFGRGDAIVLGVAGIAMGFWQCMLLFFYGVLGAAVFSIVLIIRHGFRKNLKVPLIPFLAAGYFIVLLI